MNAEQIEQKVISYCKKYGLIQKGDHILLGLSGGGDSVCLFYMLLALQKEIDFSLRAAHIHHGIRQEANQDQAYVEKLCLEHNVPCDFFTENVLEYGKAKGFSEEEAGRILRYRDFRKVLKKWGNEGVFKIATAHHMDDQAETLLFQLFRGSGLTGLCGIRKERGDIIRPLLCIRKQEIEQYLKEKQISYCHDKTNDQDHYARNKIRHHILPYAENEICQGVIEHIGNTAEVLQEADAYIQKQVQKTAHKMIKQTADRIAISIPHLQKEEIFMQKQLLLFALETISTGRKDIGYGHIQSMLQLLEKKGNGKLFLPHSIIVQKEYDLLWIGSGEEAVEESLDFDYELEVILLEEEEEIKKRFQISDASRIMDCIPEKAYTKWFDYDKIKSDLIKRHRNRGDFLTINQQFSRKSLKEYMIEAKIPQKYRDKLWVFADGSHIVWIPGYRMSSFYKVTCETKRILQITIKEMEENICQNT